MAGPRELTGLFETSRALRKADVSPDAYLEELEARFVKQEPVVMAFLPEEGRFDRLSREFSSLAGMHPEPESRPPLFGVPVGIKDIFQVQGFATRAGSQLPPEVLAGKEAGVVTRLKEAGALMAGKTVTTEFAYFGPGPTRNPLHPDHTPGGSSSGSAAAVAAGLVPLSLGTQTVGSVIRPAAYCGVVGMKPSLGLVSTRGVIPFSPTMDHVGWFTRDLEGAAMVLDILAPASRQTDSPATRTLGVPVGRYLDFADPRTREAFFGIRRHFEDNGWMIMDMPEALDDFTRIKMNHENLIAAEAAAVHKEWFATYEKSYHPLTRKLIHRGRAIDPALMADLRASGERLRKRLAMIMDRHGLDGFIAPSATGPAPRGLESTGDPVMCLPWTHAGVPAISLPWFPEPDALPLGLQVVGSHGGDHALLGLCREIQPLLAGP